MGVVLDTISKYNVILLLFLHRFIFTF